MMVIPYLEWLSGILEGTGGVPSSSLHGIDLTAHQTGCARDKISIFDALAMAGDLTIYGIRTDVAVAREVDGVRTIEYLDLTSKDLFNSPAFYIQQNDVIYVKPNKYKAQAGEISQNRNFYLSLVGTAISVATLIITLTK